MLGSLCWTKELSNGYKLLSWSNLVVFFHFAGILNFVIFPCCHRSIIMQFSNYAPEKYWLFCFDEGNYMWISSIRGQRKVSEISCTTWFLWRWYTDKRGDCILYMPSLIQKLKQKVNIIHWIKFLGVALNYDELMSWCCSYMLQ